MAKSHIDYFSGSCSVTEESCSHFLRSRYIKVTISSKRGLVFDGTFNETTEPPGNENIGGSNRIVFSDTLCII